MKISYCFASVYDTINHMPPLAYKFIDAFYDIGNAFTTDLGVWWFLAPIFILWIATEVYFGEHKREKWGFSSSLANAISFTWINIVSLRFIFLELNISTLSDVGNERLFIAVGFLVYGFFLIYLAFAHKFSERVLSWIAGPTPIYFLSVVSVLWGQGLLAVTPYVAADFFVIFAIVSVIWGIVKSRLGSPYEGIEVAEEETEAAEEAEEENIA